MPSQDPKSDASFCGALKNKTKRALGKGLIFLAEKLPALRPSFQSLGLRTSRGLFSHRTVSIPIRGQRPLLLTHVDESYLAFQLFWRGGNYYEPLTRELLRMLLKPGDTFLDLGAHAGFFSLTVGRHIPGVQVIAFEPNPKNFRMLETNAAANGLKGLR
jgi:hypothetical protein